MDRGWDEKEKKSRLEGSSANCRRSMVEREEEVEEWAVMVDWEERGEDET